MGEQRRREQREKLLKLKSDIKDTKFLLRKTKLKAKIKAIRKAEIKKKAYKLFAPYALSWLIIIGGELIRENYTNDYYYIMEELDNEGNIIKTEKSLSKIGDTSTIYHNQKWEQAENGKFKRIVEPYSFSTSSYDKIIKSLAENTKLEDLLGTKKDDIIEIESNISEDELNEEESYTAKVYYQDEDNPLPNRIDGDDILIWYLCFLAGLSSSALIRCNHLRKYPSYYKYFQKEMEPFLEETDDEVLTRKLTKLEDEYEKLNSRINKK